MCKYYCKRIDFAEILQTQGKPAVSQEMMGEESGAAQADICSDDDECANKTDGIDQYQTEPEFYNNLNQSISLLEKSAKKLLPIFEEMSKKLVPWKNSKDMITLNFENEDRKDKKLLSKIKTNKANMKHILGFLN